MVDYQSRISIIAETDLYDELRYFETLDGVDEGDIGGYFYFFLLVDFDFGDDGVAGVVDI